MVERDVPTGAAAESGDGGGRWRWVETDNAAWRGAAVAWRGAALAGSPAVGGSREMTEEYAAVEGGVVVVGEVGARRSGDAARWGRSFGEAEAVK